MASFLGLLLWSVAVAAGSARADGAMDNVQSHASDVQGLVEQGGLPKGRTVAPCSSVCTALWSAEHRHASNVEARDALASQLLTLRVNARLLPEIGTFASPFGMALLGEMPYKVGWHIGDASRKLWFTIDMPARPVPLGIGTSPPELTRARFFRAGTLMGQATPRHTAYAHLELSGLPADGLVAGTELGRGDPMLTGASPAYPTWKSVSPFDPFTWDLGTAPYTSSATYWWSKGSLNAVGTARPAGVIQQDPDISWPTGGQGTNGESVASTQARVMSELADHPGRYSVLIPWLDANLGGASEDPTMRYPTGAESYGPGGAEGAAPGYGGCSKGQPVDCATGNQWEQQSDLSLEGLGGLDLRRTYNSQAAAQPDAPRGSLGYGWRQRYRASLAVAPSGLTATAYLDDGSALRYARTTPTGDWQADAWNRAALSSSIDETSTLTFPDGRQLRFAAGGRLSTVSDRDGNETVLAYDGGGRLMRVTAPSGLDIDFTYNSDGTVATATGPSDEQVSYEYDDGELTAVHNADGHAWHYEYDGQHQLVSMTDPRGSHTSTVYDAEHRVVDQTQPGGGHYTWDWQADGKVEITDPAGNTTDEIFLRNQLVSITSAVGTVAERHETFTHDTVGNLIERRDGRGSIWAYTYDDDGNALTASDPQGRTTSRTYNASHDVTSVTLPSGRKTIYDRDPAGHVLHATIQSADGNDHAMTTFTYTSAGQLATVTDPLGHTMTYTHNAAGDLLSTEDPRGHTTSYTYDDASRLASVTSPRGNESGADPDDFTTTILRDVLGRPTSTTDGSGRHTSTVYDALGNTVSTTDALGNTTTAVYDAENQQTSVTRPGGLTSHTSYDAGGQVATHTDPEGHVTTYAHDAAGRVSSVTDPTGRVRQFSYDANGNQTTSTDAAGRVTTTTFDVANRPTFIHYSSGDPGDTDTDIDYDADGQVTQTTDDSDTTTNAYDSLGRLHSRTDGNAKTVTYAYDDDSRITKITYPVLPDSSEGGDVIRTYDADDNLASVTDWHGRTTTFAANAEEQPVTTTFPTASHEVDTSVYNKAGELASISATTSGATLAGFAYEHDDAGRVTQATTTGSTLTGGTDSYGFDARGQLTSANDQTYGHTAAGALTSLDGVTDARYDDAGQLTEATVDGGATTYAYDANGQRTTSTPLNGGATTYDYDQAGALTAVHPARQSPSDSAGWNHGLAVDANGTTHGWGLNNFGQIGDGTNATQAFPVAVVGLADVTAVAAGAAHSLALNDHGRVYSWGDNTFGELGAAPGSGRSVPAKIAGLSSVKRIAAGTFHSLALDTSGEVYSWGWNANGQLGDGTTTDHGVPQHVTGLPAIKQIVASYKDSYALDSSGIVWAWGANDKRQLGDATTTDRHTPVEVQGLPAGIKQVAGSVDFAVALDSAGQVWIWGGAMTAAVQLTGVSNITQISAGASHVVALDSTGHVQVIGDNGLGQLANGTTGGSSASWVQVPGVTDATAVSAGIAHSYALKSDGTIMAWGYNNNGETGNGQTANIITTPVSVESLTLTVPQRTSTYEYDAAGLRTTKTIGTTTTQYTWDTQTGELPLILADTTHQYIYGPGDEPLEQIAADGTTNYLHHDQLGSTRLATHTDGTVAGTATYTPYGAPAGQTGTTSALGYAGQYTDPDTGLIYLRARDYDPATGQFLTRDPIEAFTRDAYRYGDNDPVDNVDPSGLDFLGIGRALSEHLRPVASAVAGVGTIAGCVALPEACVGLIAANAAFQAGLAIQNPELTGGQKVAEVALVGILATGAVGTFAVSQSMESGVGLLSVAPRWLLNLQLGLDTGLGVSLEMVRGLDELRC